MGFKDFISRVKNRQTRQQQLSQKATIHAHEPNRQKLAKQVIVRQQNRQKEDTGKWRSATDSAENVHNPNRFRLIRIYKDVVIDAHLSALMRTIVLKCLASDTWLEDKDGKIDDLQSPAVKKRWFIDAITHALDSQFWGHSLVQFDGPVTKIDGFAKTVLIPRQNVVPEVKGMKPEANINSLIIPYDTPTYKNWVVEFGDSHDLGLLFKATPLVLWKKNVTIAWSEYAEVFGMPLRVGRTDITDPNRKANMEDMLNNLGGSGHATLHEDDLIEFVETNQDDAHKVFKEFIEMANKELSKLVVGQTMTNEDGSSRSQAEVHENLLSDLVTATKRWLWTEVNTKIIPIMERQNIITEGLIWNYDQSEKVSLKEEFEFVDKLLTHFDIKPEFIKDRYGVPVEEKENPIPDLSQFDTKKKEKATDIINEIHEYYKDHKPLDYGHKH